MLRETIIELQKKRLRLRTRCEDLLSPGYRRRPDWKMLATLRGIEALLGLRVAKLSLELLVLRHAEQGLIQIQTKIVELNQSRMTLVNQLAASEPGRYDLNTRPDLDQLTQLEYALSDVERRLREIGETLE